MSLLSLALPLLLAVQTPPDDAKAKEAEAKKRVSEFQKAVAKAKPEERPGLITALGELQHPKVLEELAKWLGKGDADCLKAAEAQISNYKNLQKAADYLIRAARAQKDPELGASLLASAGNVGFKGSVKDLATFFRHAQIPMAKAAVDAVGTLRTRDGMAPLLDLLRELEMIREDDDDVGNMPGAPGPGGPNPGPTRGNDDKIRRKNEVLPSVQSALKNTTGQNFEKAKDWAAWWAKNAKTFKDPE